nr:hypothetical protein Iba_chr10aCG8270 [Ipomoea batatas]
MAAAKGAWLWLLRSHVMAAMCEIYAKQADNNDHWSLHKPFAAVDGGSIERFPAVTPIRVYNQKFLDFFPSSNLIGTVLGRTNKNNPRPQNPIVGNWSKANTLEGKKKKALVESFGEELRRDHGFGIISLLLTLGKRIHWLKYVFPEARCWPLCCIALHYVDTPSNSHPPDIDHQDTISQQGNSQAIQRTSCRIQKQSSRTTKTSIGQNNQSQNSHEPEHPSHLENEA